MNGFVCGMRKFDKHKMAIPERPTNSALYAEHQKNLNELLKQREQQDNGIFVPIPLNHPVSTNDSKEYTPWTTPSANK